MQSFLLRYRLSTLFCFVLSFNIFISPIVVDAKKLAIARFDIIPYQIITAPFQVGVVAFHIDGIDSVEFAISDGVTRKVIRVSEMILNPRTDVLEYWITIDPSEFKDGLLTINADVNVIALPDEKRSLTSFLYANANSTLDERKKYYVSLNGSDSNPGSQQKPFATIQSALYPFKGTNGGEIILLDEGVYNVGNVNNNKSPLALDHWITIRAADNLIRDKVIISKKEKGLLRLYSGKIHWQRVSFDFKNISQIYNSGSLDWFDNCRWFSSVGWGVSYPGQLKNVREYYYVTDSIAEDLVYGFTAATLVRNCTLNQISGDALQLSKTVLNTTLDNVNGTILGHHTDIYQMWGGLDNVILYNVTSTNLVDTQILFLEPTYQEAENDPQYKLSNMAIINCSFFNRPRLYQGNPNNGGPPWSQFISSFEHVFIRNTQIPGQRIVFRTDVTGNQQWQATDIVFENCTLHYITFRSLFDQKYSNYSGIPGGVTFRNCQSGSPDYDGTPPY